MKKSGPGTTDPKTIDTDILISGAGAAGLALAVLLGRQGWRVTVIDKGSPPAPLAKTKASGRTVALMQSSLAVLKDCEAWEALAPLGGAMHTMRLIDDSGPRLLPGEKLDFQAGEAGFESFGVNIPVSFLRAALWERAAELKTVTLRPQTGFARFEAGPGKIAIHSESGEIFRASLLVGADGAKSPVREQAGIPCSVRDYGRKAITCLIRHTRPHLNVSTEFHRPSGPFALVPLPGLASSVVWVEPEDKADSFFALPREAFARALEERTGGLLGEVAVETAPEIWPLRALRARKLTAPRMALVAEAAHTMSPITAQGLNLSLRDVADLARIAGEQRALGLDPGGPALLMAYEKSRRADILTRTAGVDALMRLVGAEGRLPRLVRRGAMQAVGLLPPLRKFAITSGMGLSPFRRAG